MNASILPAHDPLDAALMGLVVLVASEPILTHREMERLIATFRRNYPEIVMDLSKTPKQPKAVSA